MEGIDATMVATALPAIARDLGVAPVDLKLALSAYLLALAGFIPISAWCADRFGVRTVFCAAIALFVLGSLGCAAATGLPAFAAARGVQGVGAALIFPVGRLILLRNVPKRGLVHAFSAVTIPTMVGPICGPLIGGYITTYLHWTWLFWVNLPIGVAGCVATLSLLPREAAIVRQPLDLAGFVLAGLGIAVLGGGLTLVNGPAILAGLMLLGLYRWHARRVAMPILDVTPLGFSTYRIGLACGFCFRAGAWALSFLVPMLLQVDFGLSAFESGTLTVGAAFGTLATKFAIGPILRRFGFPRMLAANGLLVVLSIAGLALLVPATPRVAIMAALGAGAFCRTLQIMGLETLSYAELPEAAMGRAATLASVAKQLAAATGVAYAALVLEPARGVAGFRVAFLLVALPVAVSVLLNLRLARDAGAELSGHRPAES